MFEQTVYASVCVLVIETVAGWILVSHYFSSFQKYASGAHFQPTITTEQTNSANPGFDVEKINTSIMKIKHFMKKDYLLSGNIKQFKLGTVIRRLMVFHFIWFFVCMIQVGLLVYQHN